MPRAVDPIGRYLTADYDPASKNLLFDPQTLPKIDLWAIIKGWIDQAIDWVIKFIRDLTGIDLGPLREIAREIAQNIRDMLSPQAIISSLMRLIRGVSDAIKSKTGIDLFAICDGLRGFFDWLGLSLADLLPHNIINRVIDWIKSAINIDLGDIGGILGDLTNTVITIIRGLGSRILGLIPLGQLTNAPLNLLINPGFDTDQSVVGQAQWFWEAWGRTSPGGSVYTYADGTVKELESNEIAVIIDQKLDCEIYAHWENLSYTSAPFEIRLRRFSGNVEMLPITLAQMSNPGGSGGWSKLSQQYTVPSGVDAVKLVLRVNPQALTGKVSFDDASVTKPGQSLPQQWISGLVDALAGIWEWVHGIVDRLWSVFSGIAGGVGKTLDELYTAVLGGWTGVWDWLHGLVDELWAAFTQIPGQIGKTLNDLWEAAQNAVAGPGGVLTIINNIITRIFGWGSPDDRDLHLQSADALDSLRNRVLETSVVLQDLIAKLATGGVNDTFTRTANNLGPNWNVTYTSGNGDIRTNGTAYWNSAYPNGNRDALAVWVGSDFPRTVSDYQKIGFILNTTGNWMPSLGNTGHNDVICRYGPGPNYVRFRVSGDKTWEFTYFINGTRYHIGNGNLPYALGPGAFVWVAAGELETNRPSVYKCYVGNDLIVDWNDPGVASMGANYRQFGFGMRAESLILALDQQKPAALAQFIAADQ